MAFFSTKMGQFTYFSLQVSEPVWRGKNVLDFGGNIGNMLRDPNSTIDHERYWCLDVAKESIEKGKAAYPNSHWLFYNRYCFFFNPHGVPNLALPNLDQAFDYIVAYSVFTNTTPTDMLQLVKQLEGLLATDGTLAFTFIDPHYYSWPGHYYGDNFQWRLIEKTIGRRASQSRRYRHAESGREERKTPIGSRLSTATIYTLRLKIFSASNGTTGNVSCLLHRNIYEDPVAARHGHAAGQQRDAALLHHQKAMSKQTVKVGSRKEQRHGFRSTHSRAAIIV